MGLVLEFRLLQQDAGLACADDGERRYLQQVVAALTALLEPGQGHAAAEEQLLPSMDSLEGVPDEFVCPISQEIMLEPVTLEVGLPGCLQQHEYAHARVCACMVAVQHAATSFPFHRLA